MAKSLRTNSWWTLNCCSEINWAASFYWTVQNCISFCRPPPYFIISRNILFFEGIFYSFKQYFILSGNILFFQGIFFLSRNILFFQGIFYSFKEYYNLSRNIIFFQGQFLLFQAKTYSFKKYYIISRNIWVYHLDVTSEFFGLGPST